MAPVKPKYQTIAGRDNDTLDDDMDAAADTAKPADQPIEVIVLDFTHSRFTVPLAAGLTATVADLKTAGALHHNVPAQQQRLIYQGKLLSDDLATLRQCNIHHGSIVHLFPKPRVVVTNGQPEASSAASSQQSPSNGGAAGSGETTTNGGGGRVPTIILNEAEHARRGQILVLGSVDYMEAVNNVKLFSFMLLIISTIELLNLIAVALGEGTVDNGESGMAYPHNEAMPYVEHDDFFPSDDDGTSPDNVSASSNAGFGNGTTEANDNNSNGTDFTTGGGFANPYQTWTPLSWLDLVVSVLGIYVALLGIRASNDNVLSIARLYLLGTAITAVGWLVYNFIINFEIDEMARDNAQHESSAGGHNNNIAPLNGNTGANGDSVFNQAVQAMVLPAVVWGLCIFRAWQFQHLLAEAELEAMERIQAEQEGGGESGNGSGNDEEQALQQQFGGQPSSSSAPTPLPAIS
jgi:hypothetical protein